MRVKLLKVYKGHTPGDTIVIDRISGIALIARGKAMLSKDMIDKDYKVK